VAISSYRSYLFRDKDPIIDLVRTAVQDSGLNYTQLEWKSGVHKRTIYAWFHGETKRPQAATINAVLRGIGYRLAVVKGRIT